MLVPDEREVTGLRAVVMDFGLARGFWRCRNREFYIPRLGES